ncbi:MAG: hypothetical protein IPK52_27280 [Chloroflexi bacterium]|nr:hypothetical protein [Chloroflexota bacterium]
MTPADWVRDEIASVIENLVTGTSVNGEDRRKAPDEMAVLKVSAVTYGNFNPLAHKTVTSEDEIRRLQAPVCGDTVLVSRANTRELVGASAYVSDDHPGLFLPDKLWQLEQSPITQPSG